VNRSDPRHEADAEPSGPAPARLSRPAEAAAGDGAETAGPPADWRWPGIHPEGLRFAALFGLSALLAFALGWTLLAWPLAAATALSVLFFRDPLRVTPIGDDLLVAPADGLVCQIAHVPVPGELRGEGGLASATALRVSIFLSVFDVHIVRAPLPGRIVRLRHIAGQFLNAGLDRASTDNERQALVIEASDGTRAGVMLVAGLIARRIVGFVAEQDQLSPGERIGLIRFGSRADLYLPEGFVPLVAKGQRTVAGETVIARRGGLAPAFGPRH